PRHCWEQQLGAGPATLSQAFPARTHIGARPRILSLPSRVAVRSHPLRRQFPQSGYRASAPAPAIRGRAPLRRRRDGIFLPLIIPPLKITLHLPLHVPLPIFSELRWCASGAWTTPLVIVWMCGSMEAWVWRGGGAESWKRG